MSITTASPSFATRPTTLPLRVVLLVVALAAVAASFAIGHSTAAGTTQVVHRVLVPAAAPASQSGPACSYNRVGYAC